VKGAALVLTGLLLLPGSVWMLLASNFGALKGYLIAATSLFGFLILLSATWSFGLPGTPALTGPVGKQPSFIQFGKTDPVASQYDKVASFQGAAGNGWVPAPGEGQLSAKDEKLKADLDAAKQAALSKFIAERNKGVKDSSQELDVTNTDTKVFYTTQNGTTVAAVVISPKAPPAGSGLRTPTFSPVPAFAYQDRGAPSLPSYLFLGGSTVLFLLHAWLLGLVERRRPLGAGLSPQAEPRPVTQTRA